MMKWNTTVARKEYLKSNKERLRIVRNVVVPWRSVDRPLNMHAYVDNMHRTRLLLEDGATMPRIYRRHAVCFCISPICCTTPQWHRGHPPISRLVGAERLRLVGAIREFQPRYGNARFNAGRNREFASTISQYFWQKIGILLLRVLVDLCSS